MAFGDAFPMIPWAWRTDPSKVTNDPSTWTNTAQQPEGYTPWQSSNPIQSAQQSTTAVANPYGPTPGMSQPTPEQMAINRAKWHTEDLMNGNRGPKYTADHLQNNPYMPGNSTGTPTAQSSSTQPPVGFENPYMKAQADAMTQQVAQNFNQQIMPSIRRGSMATGGFGGSRQGIAEGMATQGAQQALSNSLAGLYGQGYRDDRTYDLGLGSLAAQNRGLDLQSQRLGGDLFTQALNNGIGVGNALYQSGQREMLAPWQNAINPYLNAINLLAGNSGTVSTGGQSGGGWTGALGGAISGAQLAKLLFGG
jgi:hypothetical protein